LEITGLFEVSQATRRGDPSRHPQAASEVGVAASRSTKAGSRVTIIGLDPGYEKSALVVLSGGVPIESHLEPNEAILRWLLTVPGSLRGETLVIEQIQSFGMAVGQEVFETVFWSGRFAQAWSSGGWASSAVRVPRRAVKLELCKSPKANDASIRQALIDHYGPGREKAIGKKAAPGPLYNIKADLWSALAVAVTYERQRAALEAAS
jgi:hypothetical protein